MNFKPSICTNYRSATERMTGLTIIQLHEYIYVCKAACPAEGEVAKVMIGTAIS